LNEIIQILIRSPAATDVKTSDVASSTETENNIGEVDSNSLSSDEANNKQV
jgi:hypothetical protein